MKTKNKEAYGTLTFHYSTIMLPLASAHKLQELLTEAVQVDDVWRNAGGKAASCMKMYDVPDVEVAREFPEHDATGVADKVLSAWKEALRNTESGEVMPLKDFVATYGEGDK